MHYGIIATDTDGTARYWDDRPDRATAEAHGEEVVAAKSVLVDFDVTEFETWDDLADFRRDHGYFHPDQMPDRPADVDPRPDVDTDTEPKPEPAPTPAKKLTRRASKKKGS
jgi:hypothetical protein